jgi:hypothetical protein
MSGSAPFNFYGDTGWTGTPAVMTYANGTMAGNATLGNASQGVGSNAATLSSCAFCSNPMVQECLFFIAILLLAIGWHFHLYSLLED